MTESKAKAVLKAARRRKLGCRLKSLAWSALTQMPAELDQPLQVQARAGACIVTVTAGPAAAPAASSAAAGPLVGLFLSPLERLVVDAVRREKAENPDRPLIGKQIARAAGQPYDSKLRIILANLVERQVLTHDDGETEGYALAVRA